MPARSLVLLGLVVGVFAWPAPRAVEELQPDVYYDPLAGLTRQEWHWMEHGGEPDALPVRFSVLEGVEGMRPDVADNELLEIMGEVPGAARLTAMRHAGIVRVKGSKSEFWVDYGDGVPSEAKKPIEGSMKAWADTFPSAVPIRIRFDWQDIGFETLAATTNPFFISGSFNGADKLDNDTLYGSVMAASLEGRDFVSASEAHIAMTVNSKASWHFGDDPAPLRQWDLRTACLHEICHGLFFSGLVKASNDRKVAGFSSKSKRPGRFDRFLAAGNSASLARTCSNDTSNFYNAVTNGGLRFLDSEQPGVDFGLYSPYEYEAASSTYHNDHARLEKDCQRAGIASSDCSDLMTERLANGYTQRSIGEPVVRMMNSMRSRSHGTTNQTSCDVAPGVPGSGTDGNPFAGIPIFPNDV